MYLHFGASEVIRYIRTIDRLNDRYGLHLDSSEILIHLDDWKRIGPNQMGQKCGRGWEGLRGACKRVPKGGDRSSAIRASKQALAAIIRKKKGMSEIVDRDGKKDPVSYAFVPGKNKSSTMQARRTSSPKKGWQPPERTARLMAKEERRALVGLGVSPGKKLIPDDAPMMERSQKPNTTKGASLDKARRMREAIANAPVQIPNQRRSNQPRKRGRSVD